MLICEDGKRELQKNKIHEIKDCPTYYYQNLKADATTNM